MTKETHDLGIYPPTEKTLKFNYVNYRGVRSVRTATPREFYFGSTDYHPEKQWLMRAFDHDKEALRIFALKDCGFLAGDIEPVRGTIDRAVEVALEAAADEAEGDLDFQPKKAVLSLNTVSGRYKIIARALAGGFATADAEGKWTKDTEVGVYDKDAPGAGPRELVERLRGRYAMGRHLPNGDPELGFRQFETPSIQHEAADALTAALDHIEGLESKLADAVEAEKDATSVLDAWFDRRKLGHEAVDQAVIDAASGYLRTSRSGGMETSESDLILAVIEDMTRLGLFADLFARATIPLNKKGST